MLFNSFEFAIFLPIVFLLYWLVTARNLIAQNVLLLAASFVFYGFWDYRFLLLLCFSTVLDFVSGLQMHAASNEKKRRVWFWLSIALNLGFLGFFKYYNFFINSFIDAFASLGIHLNAASISIILPVGISFYTFHGLSYVIDIYNRRIQPEKNFINYAVFVCFFPLLVAGPIERATHLLPQIQKPRIFNYHQAIDGLRQILWGLLKKMIIADNCAIFVNLIFEQPNIHSGSTLFVAAIFFAFQIYCDFSGYSDIAIGTAKLFGISLLRNFAFPYFSRDIAEFWRRWHMSLSSWFRDYVYIPLGGNQGSLVKKIRNVFIIFLLSGFWHGANWTFVIWGLLNAIYFIPLLITNKNRVHTDIVGGNRMLPRLKECWQMGTTFFLTVIAWVFFRSLNVSDAFQILGRIFSFSLFETPFGFPIKTSIFILLLLIVEWIQRHKHHPFQFDEKIPFVIRWGIYYSSIVMLFLYGARQQEFIYFKF